MRCIVLLAAVAGALALGVAASQASHEARLPAHVYAVSIDPADYLATVPDATVLAKRLVAELTANRINTIYLNAYNVQYGAYYQTSYRYNHESEYGRQDLLGKLLAAAHARDIDVVAAFYDH